MSTGFDDCVRVWDLRRMDEAVSEIAAAKGGGVGGHDEDDDDDDDDDDEPISHRIVPAMALSGHLGPRCSWPHKLIFHPCYLPLARPQPLAAKGSDPRRVCGAICTVGPKSRALTLFNVLDGGAGESGREEGKEKGDGEDEGDNGASLWSLRSRGNVGSLDLGALACTEDDGSGGGSGCVDAAGHTCLVAAAQVTRGRDGAIAVLEVV